MGFESGARNDQRKRQPHVVMDRDSRICKARKIIALLGEDRFRSARRVLEIGCGSGVISSTLSQMGSDALDVHAVDVIDNRIEMDGYAFRVVTGTALPFDDGFFDIVISNHVVEHVGDQSDQLHHLAEIRRVLGPNGIGYLAVPNKWRLIEPHYRLPFLSWLGQSASDRYVRIAHKGTHYDCKPLAFKEALALFDAAGFTARDMTIRALRETLHIEFPDNPAARMFNGVVPDWVPAIALAVMPTYIFLLRTRS